MCDKPLQRYAYVYGICQVKPMPYGEYVRYEDIRDFLPHDWTDACNVIDKTTNETWQLESCECGDMRIKEGTRKQL